MSRSNQNNSRTGPGSSKDKNQSGSDKKKGTGQGQDQKTVTITNSKPVTNAKDIVSNQNLDLSRSPHKSQAITIKVTPSRAPGLEVLRRTQFLFIKTTTTDAPFLLESVNKFEVFNEKAKRIFWVKEMEGDGRKFSLGGTFDIIYCILSMDGRELIRCEGNRGKRGIKAALSVFMGPLFIGDVIQKNGRYMSPLFHIVDDTQQDIAIIKASDNARINESKSNCCCKKTVKIGDKQYFDIFLPDTRSRIGTAGKIAKFFPLVSREMDNLFGVELSDAMTNKEKSLLFAFCLLFTLNKADTKASTANDKLSNQPQGDSKIVTN